jgi:hypothetical protein
MALLGRVPPRDLHIEEPPREITLNFGTTLRPPRTAIEHGEQSMDNAAPKLLPALRVE